VDEKTAFQALDRLDPVLPLSLGRLESHGFEYWRNGTLSLHAALDVKRKVRRRSRISVEAMWHSGRKSRRRQSQILPASIRSFYFFAAAIARRISGCATFT
jgi:hypothetical protein